MLFRSLFTGVPADLNAYRARLQAAMRLYAALATLGAFTLLFGILGVPALLPEGGNVEYFSGFYCGMGTGLALGFLVLILRTRRLLRNEAALRRPCWPPGSRCSFCCTLPCWWAACSPRRCSASRWPACWLSHCCSACFSCITAGSCNFKAAALPSASLVKGRWHGRRAVTEGLSHG